MAPVARLTALALVLSAAFASASPVLAPIDPSGPTPAFARDNSYALAAAPSVPKVKAKASVAVGVKITHCTVPGTIALTFDDGPGNETGKLLDYIRGRKEKPKVTFFVNGNNHGDLRTEKDKIKVFKQAYADGHQLASHTMTHDYRLTDINDQLIKKEMTDLEAVFKKHLKVIPTYMRPPEGALDARVLKVLGGLKYKVIHWSHDTNDWKNNIATSLSIYHKKGPKGDTPSGVLWPGNLKAGNGPIVLHHDTVKSTALVLGPKVIDMAIKSGFKLVTVAECLGDKNGAYRK